MAIEPAKDGPADNDTQYDQEDESDEESQPKSGLEEADDTSVEGMLLASTPMVQPSSDIS